MKSDIIISGVGGQGILSIAGITGLAALANNMYLKQSEVHGMSQRGGDVQSHFRLSDKPIASDLIPFGKADLIISIEPMEALRYLPWLSNSGWVVTNSVPVINIPNYPEVDRIIGEIKKVKNSIILDADTVAREAGSVKAGNVVILGAASPHIDIPFSDMEQAVETFFKKKGNDIVALNLKALRAGRKLSQNLK
ncbi:MAG: indolepyruvate oxidoreductase subunit beta [Bacteroidales bacterium]|jgi:indolepyruvate ferredoxin oxidoreductase beta subunit|nr:indolepyruvate oxidoreductase subunit beta [Bacteroidales bacterium]